MKKLLGIVVISLLLSSNDQSFISYTDYKKYLIDDPEWTETYLYGVLSGLQVSNAFLDDNKYFCLPENFKLNTQNLKDAIKLSAEAYKIKTGEEAYGMVPTMALTGLQMTFPCK